MATSPASSPTNANVDVTQQAAAPTSQKGVLSEVLPKAGLVYSEKGNLSEVLCKPKIMPIKSITLEKIEKMEKELQASSQQSPEGIKKPSGSGNLA